MSLALAATVLPTTAAIAATATSPITYIYDDLGRLEAVVDPSLASSQIAKFTYDAVGNLMQITRSSISTTPTIIDFHSHRAAIGATVTIYGAGFSATPSQNKITFTGATAVDAVTATTTTLTVAVPAAATTGGIKVKNTATNKTSALSSQSWSAPTAAPAITSISSPMGGTPPRANLGDVITVNGSGFATTPADNLVRLNQVVMRVLTATATRLTVQVPDLGVGIGSAPITVRTANGFATSPQPLVLPEEGHPADTFNQVLQWSGNQTGPVTIPNGQWNALILFPATQGQQIFHSTTDLSSELWNPFSVTAAQYSETGHNLGEAEVTGTYALWVKRIDIFGAPITTGTTTVTVDVEVSDTSNYGEVNPTPSASFSIPRDYPGQFSAFEFKATSGRTYCIDVGSPTTPLFLYRPSFPDGEITGIGFLKNRPASFSHGDLNFVASESGTWIAIVHGSFTSPAPDEDVVLTDAGSGSCPPSTLSLAQQGDAVAPVGPEEPTIQEVSGSFEPEGSVEWEPGPGSDQMEWVTDRGTSPFQRLASLVAPEGGAGVAGQVLALDGGPLPGVEVTTSGTSTVTDEAGRFALSGLQPGRVVLTVDARGVSARGGTYGVYEIGADLEQGSTKTLDTIWEPSLDLRSQIHLGTYPLVDQVTITNPDMPGFQVVIPKGSRIVDASGEEVHDVTLTPVPLDRMPFPGPEMNQFTMHFTLQPGDAHVEPNGFRVIYANNTHLAPGFTGRVWSYEPDEGWDSYGTATVTPDGQQVRPEPSARVYGFQGASMSALMLALLDTRCRDDLIPGACSPDPVDMGNGLFDYAMTDLVEPGTPQLSLTRHYRQNDATTYATGIGMSSPYEMLLNSDQPSNYAYVSVPGDRRVRFEPVNGPGTGIPMIAVSGPQAWIGAYLNDRGTGAPYEVRRRDGTWFTFAGPGGTWLSNITDRSGNQIVITRTIGGSLESVLATPSGRWIDFDHTHPQSSRIITSATDQAGRTVTYHYSSSAPIRLLDVTDPSQQGLPTPKKTVYTWNPDTSLCSTGAPCSPSPGTYLFDVYDRRGNHALHLDYDGQGRISLQTFANAGAYSFDYNSPNASCLGSTRSVGPTGSVTCARYANGVISSVTSAQGSPQEHTTTYTLDPGGSASTAQETFLVAGVSHTRRTDYGYDARGNLASITYLATTANPKVWSFGHNKAYNTLSTITDPLGHGRTLTYSLPEGCLTRAEDNTAVGSSFTCTNAGQLKTVKSDLAGAVTTKLAYANGDLMKVTDPLGNVTTRFTGSDGSVRSVTDPTGYATALAYDVLGQLTKVNPVSGSSTSFLYDEEQNLTRITLDATGAATRYEYNEVNLISKQIDPLNRQATFIYDGAGTLARAKDHRAKVTKYCTDAAGNVNFIGYGYTGAGEPACNSTFSSTTAFTYDGAGRLGQVVDSIAGNITRTYDDLDRMTNETTPQGSLTYTYDNANRRTKLAVAGQPDIVYAYFTSDRLKTITRGTDVVNLAYDLAGRPDTTTLPNGVVEDWTYDQANRMIGATYAKAGQSSLGALSYGVDAAGRPTTVWGASGRITLPSATSVASYDLASELKTWNGAALTYDNNGNLAANGAQSYIYNDRNQLASTSGGTSSFAYDGLGRRFGKTVSGTTTRYLYDGANVVQELNGSNTPTANLLTGFAPDQVYWRSGGTTATTDSVLTDDLGSTVATTTPAATPAVRTSFTYEPFGKPSSTAFPYLFTGRDYDTATGLQYNRARFLAPAYGRFTAEDPIGILGGSANSYLYGGNAATAEGDPFGLKPGGHDTAVLQFWLSVAVLVFSATAFVYFAMAVSTLPVASGALAVAQVLTRGGAVLSGTSTLVALIEGSPSSQGLSAATFASGLLSVAAFALVNPLGPPLLAAGLLVGGLTLSVGVGVVGLIFAANDAW